MPWIRKKRKAEHECSLPELYRDSGHLGRPKEPVAEAGDQWYCRKCRRVWRVEAVPIAPPGFRGDLSKLTSTVLRWGETCLEMKRYG